MAEKKSTSRSSAKRATEEAPPQTQEEQLAEQSAAAEESAEEVAAAAEKRAAQAEAKGEGEDAPPPELPKKGGRSEVAYQHDRLIESALDLTGHAPHVVAGALATSDKEYVTAEEARELVEDWLERPVS